MYTHPYRFVMDTPVTPVSQSDSISWMGRIDVVVSGKEAPTAGGPHINVYGRTYEESLFLRQIVMQAISEAVNVNSPH